MMHLYLVRRWIIRAAKEQISIVKFAFFFLFFLENFLVVRFSLKIIGGPDCLIHSPQRGLGRVENLDAYQNGGLARFYEFIIRLPRIFVLSGMVEIRDDIEARAFLLNKIMIFIAV